MIRKFLHLLTKILPAVVRRRWLPFLFGALFARFVGIGRRPRNGPVTVVGLLKSTVGLGQGARLLLSTFRELGWVVTCIDIGEILYWHQNIDVELPCKAEENEGGIFLVHLNPPELAIVLPLIGRKFIRYKKIIGYWAWELEALPKSWRVGLKLVDEIWAPSSFVAQTISRYTQIPTRVVAYCVEQPMVSSLTRRDFGIPEQAFVSLVMFDMRSSAERKNPFGAIRAFRASFEDDQGALLIIKISNPADSPQIMQRIQREIGSARNIRLLFDKLSPEDQASLIQCADVIVSLHRAEGFGLVLAEAMLLGKPVIATAYSGNMDFMSKDSSILIRYRLVQVNDPQGIYKGEGLMWADPDVAEAAEWLRRLASNPHLGRRIGEQAREEARRVFSLEAFQVAVADNGRLAEHTGSQ